MVVMRDGRAERDSGVRPQHMRSCDGGEIMKTREEKIEKRINNNPIALFVHSDDAIKRKYNGSAGTNCRCAAANLEH